MGIIRLISVASAHHFYDTANSDKNDQRYIWVPFHFIPGGKGKTLSEKYPNMDSVFKTADSKSINTAFDKMEEESKKNPKKDMSSQGGEGNSEGENSEAKKEQDAFDLQFKVKKENK